MGSTPTPATNSREMRQKMIPFIIGAIVYIVVVAAPILYFADRRLFAEFRLDVADRALAELKQEYEEECADEYRLLKSRVETLSSENDELRIALEEVYGAIGSIPVMPAGLVLPP